MSARTLLAAGLVIGSVILVSSAKRGPPAPADHLVKGFSVTSKSR
jgi:hypothetical protein